MTTVQGEHEISLNGVRFPIVGQVRSSIASNYAEKFVIGDFTRDSQRNVSVLSVSDQTGGIGRREFIPGETNRSWVSELNTRRPGHLTLPPLVTQTAAVQAASFASFSEVNGVLVVGMSTKIESYNVSGDAWTSRQTTNAEIRDGKNGVLGTTEYAVFAAQSEYWWSTNGTSWTQSTQDAFKVEFWDDRFWGITSNGQLWSTTTMGSGEVNDAQLLLKTQELPLDLFVARDANGNTILYCSTQTGLFAHDVGSRKFIRTSVPVVTAGSSTHGQHVAVWRDNIYVLSRRAIHEYRPGAEATLRPVGFDLNDGTNQRQDLTEAAVGTLNELVVSIRPAISVSERSGIFGWDGHAWRKLYRHTGDIHIESMWVSNTISSAGYRLWFAISGLIFWLDLEDGLTNPKIDVTYTYQNGELRHEYPIFDADQKEITKVALTLKVEVEGSSSDEYVKVLVDFDGTGSYTQLDDTYTSDSTFNAANDRIQGDGITTFSFPSVAAPAGTEFRTLQIAVDLDRGATDTNSPDVISMTLEYLKVLDEKLAFDFELDFTRPFGGKTPNELRAAYLTAQGLKTLPEFVYRGTSYYVKVLGGRGDEMTGNEERGTQLVRVEQP